MHAEGLRRILGDKSKRGNRRVDSNRRADACQSHGGYAPLNLVEQPPNKQLLDKGSALTGKENSHVTPGAQLAEHGAQQPMGCGQRVELATPARVSQLSPAPKPLDFLSPLFSLLKVSDAAEVENERQPCPSPVPLRLGSSGGSRCGSEVPETPELSYGRPGSFTGNPRQPSAPSSAANRPERTHSTASPEDIGVECAQRRPNSETSQELECEGSVSESREYRKWSEGYTDRSRRDEGGWAAPAREEERVTEQDEWEADWARLQQWTQMELGSLEEGSLDEVGVAEGGSWQGESRWKGSDSGTEADDDEDCKCGPGVSQMLFSPTGGEERIGAGEVGPETMRGLHLSHHSCENEAAGSEPVDKQCTSALTLAGDHRNDPFPAAVGASAGHLVCRHFKRQVDAFEYADRYNDHLRVEQLEASEAGSKRTEDAVQLRAEGCHTACRPGALQVFCEEVPSASGYNRKFVSGTVEAVWQYCCSKPPQERHFYEVIREKQPCKVYCDLEFATECNSGRDGHAMVALLVTRLREEIRAVWGLEVRADTDVVELDSSTPKKFSRHLIIDLPGAAVRNNVMVGDLLSRCLDSREFFVNKDLDGDEAVPFVDMAVYSRNRHFRTYLSSKSNKHARLLPTDRYATRAACAPKALFQASLICHLGPGRAVLEGPTPMGSRADNTRRRGFQQSFHSLRIDTHLHATTSGLPSGELEQHAQKVSKFIEQAAAIRAGGAPAQVCSIVVCGDGETLAFGLTGPGSHFCENINRMHRSNHAFFIVDLEKGVYAQKCYDPDCRHFRSAWLPLPASCGCARERPQIPTEPGKGGAHATCPADCHCDACRLLSFDRNPKFGPKAGMSRHLRARRALVLHLGLDEDTSALIFATPDLPYRLL